MTTRIAGSLIVADAGILAGMNLREPNALQIRVALVGIAPAIWRRLIVPRGFHLGQLHRVIQAAFGWWDYHLHEFGIVSLDIVVEFVGKFAGIAHVSRSNEHAHNAQL